MRSETMEVLLRVTPKHASVTMWKHVLLPVVLLTSIWGAMSGSTTYYMHWVDDSYQRVFRENLSSIRACDGLRLAIWQIVGVWPSDRSEIEWFRANWISLEHGLTLYEKQLGIAAHTVDESRVLKNIGELLAELRDKVNRQIGHFDSARPDKSAPMKRDVRELIGLISTSVNELKEINERIISAASDRRIRVGRIVFVARTVLLVAGPLLGMWLGWHLARDLHHSFARILVTLKDGTTSADRDLGSIALESHQSLDDVARHAECVVQRLRTVSEELQTARREVVRSERLAAVGELAAGVAHELRNPLTSVKLLLQHAGKQSRSSMLSESNLSLILDEISRMEMTIQGLLDFSRPRTLKAYQHDLCDTIRRAINLIDGRARQQNIDIQLTKNDLQLLVHGDVEKLHQVFVNLFINAIEAMPESGRLDIYSSTIDGGRQIRVEICDTGRGIAASVLPRLFEPFATTKERGTGLGLAVSRRIICEHGGTLTGENREAGGAVFTVTLPSAELTLLGPLLSENVAVDTPQRT